jgi:hypothetical protein
MQSSRLPFASTIIVSRSVKGASTPNGSGMVHASLSQRQTWYPCSEDHQLEDPQHIQHEHDDTSNESSSLSKVSIRSRNRHFTWAWFACNMSTGGLALLLKETPHQFRGLIVLGNIVFLLDLALFILFCSLMSVRWIMFPDTLKSSLSHPTESLFIPTF